MSSRTIVIALTLLAAVACTNDIAPVVADRDVSAPQSGADVAGDERATNPSESGNGATGSRSSKDLTSTDSSSAPAVTGNTGSTPDENGDPFAADDGPAPKSWQQAWDIREYETLRSWYRANTGVAAAGLDDGDLKPSGSVVTKRSGEVIDGLLVNGSIDVLHDNVTIRNTKVVNSGDTIAINVPWVSGPDVDLLTLDNVSIIGRGNARDYRQAVGATYIGFRQRSARRNVGLRASRVYISGFGGGFRLSHYGDDQVTQSMVENIRTTPGSHNTGISFRGGTGKAVTRTWIEGSTSSALSLYPDVTPVKDFSARQNLFDGGSYSAFIGDDLGGNEGIRFSANVFTRDYKYGPVAGFKAAQRGNMWVNNRHLDGSRIGHDGSVD